MNPYAGYGIQAYWGPRREPSAQIAVRFRRMLDSLLPIDPFFDGWRFYGATRIWPLPSAPEELAGRIAECVVRADDGDPTPIYGCAFAAATRARSDTSLIIRVSAGCYAPGMVSLVNTVELQTKPLNEANGAFITQPIFEAALLAIAAAWDATWCAAYPWDIIPLWPKPGPGQPHFRMAWITYLSPRFAPMVTPPRSALVARTTQGGIVMTATKDRFDVSNPVHLAAARDIEAALAPVNALPWPPDAVPER